jgi:ribonuclease D
VSEYHYLDTAPALATFLAAAGAEPLVAVDTEAASFHRYVDRVYLVQLSTRHATAVVDPLAIPDLGPLGSLLADPRIEHVFHDADYDLRTLDRDYRFRARHLFDTRIAAQLAGEPAIGLAALLEKYLGIRLTKAHQRADWSQRPLTPAMLAYAADDTRYLPALRDALRGRLDVLGRTSWAEEEFTRLEGLRWSGPTADDGDAYTRIKGARTLDRRQLAALRELVAWRETLAAERDTALFRILANEALLAVSQALPNSVDALATIRGLPASLARRHGPALLAAVERARTLPETALPERPRGVRVPRDPDLEARVERLKTVRNAAAARLGLDPGVLCGRPTLEAIARAQPRDRDALGRLDEVRRWQVEAVGNELLGALSA